MKTSYTVVLLALVLGPGQVAAQSRPRATPAEASVKAPAPAPKGPYQPSQTLTFDLLHTRLDLRFDWAKQQVLGTATLRVKPYFYPQTTLDLNARDLLIKSIFLKDTLTQYDSLRRKVTRTYVFDTLRYAYTDPRTLSVTLPRRYTRLDTFDLQIVYAAKPNERPAANRAGAITDDRGLYFINPDGTDPTKPRQIWTQGETQNNSCWFPTFDTPNEKMTQEIFLTVDTKYRTLSNGRLVSSVRHADSTRTDYWAQWKPHAPYLAMIAVGEFAYVADQVVVPNGPNNLEVSYYVEPAYEKYARSIFGRTPKMIQFFSTLFGVAFPWDKYSQIAVRDFVSGAMENTTATVHAETVQMDDRQLLEENSDAVIAHELSHHWFGDLVTCESWANLPLNESFATYAEYLWFAHDRSQAEADMHGQSDLDQYLAEAEQKQEPLIRYHFTDREAMFDSHSYAKGGRVLHLLRKIIGDDAFFRALTVYLTRHRFGSTEVADLREAVEAVTGEDMNWFFTQWFLSPGHAIIKVRTRYEPGNLQLHVSQVQDSTTTPVYRLPIKVAVWTGGKRTEYDIVLNRARQTFTFPAQQRPDLVVFDSDHRIVGTVGQDKNLRERIFQFYHADTYQDKYESIASLDSKLVSLDTSVRAMLITALNDPFWKIRQLALGKLADYSGPQAALFEQLVQSRVRQDTKATVRAEALTTLASFNHASNRSLFRQALNDSSYAVVAATLTAYLATNPDDAPEMAAGFEQVTNGDISLAVASYYANTAPASRADDSRFDWFVKKLHRLQPSDQYNFLQVFGVYLIRAEPGLQRRSIPLLETIARSEPAYFLRFGAYQVLGLLEDLKGVKALRREVRLHEHDSRLNELYKQFQDF